MGTAMEAMSRASIVSAGVILAGLLGACGSSDFIILGPTPLDEGIILYIHADYTGPSQALNVDVRDLDRVEGPCSEGGEGEVPSWHECVSSIRVLPGWMATLYEDEDFEGESLTITADVPNLRDLPGPCDDSFNDCIRSIRVARQ
jgi:hypothetical protein